MSEKTEEKTDQQPEEQKVTTLTGLVVITCIVQRGRADDVMKAASAAGASGATIYFARGTGIREKLGLLGIAIQAEKEVISICVPEGNAQPVFDAMVKAGKLNTPGMGFIYQTKVDKAVTYIPDDASK
jgi:nitrogen regulatory protein PII